MTARDRVALAAVVWAVLLAQVLLYPGIDLLVGALGATDLLRASTWFLAAEFAAFVVAAGPWGAASDALGRRVPLVAAGCLLGTVGYALLAWLVVASGTGGVPFALVLALRFLQGAATVGAFSLAMAMLADLGGGQGRNMGTAGIAIGLGTAMGAPIGGVLYGRGPAAPLVGAAALLVVAAGLATLVPDRAGVVHGVGTAERGSGRGASRAGPNRAAGDHATRASEGMRAALVGIREIPALVVPYAFGFADRFTAGFFALVGTLYFRTVFELDPGATGLTLALFFAPFALLQYPMGRLSDRIGRTVPIVAGSALYGVAVLGVGLAPSLSLVQAGMVAVGVLGAVMAPATMALVADLSPADRRGVAMAGFNVAGSLGFLAGIVGGGLLADRAGFLVAFGAAGGLEILLAAVTLPALLRLQVRREKVFG